MYASPCNVFCKKKITTRLEDSQDFRHRSLHSRPIFFIVDAAEDRFLHNEIKCVRTVRNSCCVNDVIDDVVFDSVVLVQGDGFPGNASYVATYDLDAAQGQKQGQAAASGADVNGP